MGQVNANCRDNTKKQSLMVDDLKSICALYGLGGSPGEYKIITEVFLYKYLNDKFIYDAKQIVPTFKDLAPANVEAENFVKLPENEYELMLMGFWCRNGKAQNVSTLYPIFLTVRIKKVFHTLFDEDSSGYC